MSYYALKDVDWPWDDEDEGRAIVVRADTPEEAVRLATAKHLAEFPGAGGVTWVVARLNLVAFGDASWEDDNQPVFEALTYYAAGINGPPDRPPSPSPSIPEEKGGTAESVRAFKLGDRVRKHSGAWWEGCVVGFYSTKQTPAGYNVQMDTVENGPVQIYPESALELAAPFSASPTEGQTVKEGDTE